MNNEKYDEIKNRIIKDNNITKNVSIAFFTGGFMGIIGELLFNLYVMKFNEQNSSFLVFSTFILIGSLLTGIGIFDKILSFCKCGLIVPSTGFANTMTSSAMDNKSEGLIKGIGANIFKLTGSIILYGTLFGLIFGVIRSII
jgi:stage V sporulation protein AC